MKRKELIEINKRFTEIENITGVEFSYKMNYNKKIIKSEIELIHSSLKQSPKYTEYLQKEKQLIEKYAEKSETGELKQIQHDNGNVSITITNIDEFNIFHTKLNEEYKDDINDYMILQQEYNNFLDEKYDTSVFKFISLNILPENITLKQMEILDYFIND